MTQRPGGPVDPDSPVLAPREEQALEEAVRPVAARGRGVTVAAILIVLAFVVGLVRPWDFLAGAGSPARPVASGALVASTPGLEPTADPGAGEPIPSEGAKAPTCGYPMGWRSATLQIWGGRRARVWSAVDVVQATGPADPSITYNVVAGSDFTAIGWCAPVAGDERPPLTATGRLYRIGTDGTAEELAYQRLEPPAASSLGELWIPDGSSGATGTPWATGRYLIELATPDGTWSRWLGIELREVATGTQSPGPSAPASPTDGASGVPTPSPGPSASARP